VAGDAEAGVRRRLAAAAVGLPREPPCEAKDLCRITRPVPRPFSCQEVDGAPGDADDVSLPGLDRWRCPCWLGSCLIVGRLHFVCHFLELSALQ